QWADNLNTSLYQAMQELASNNQLPPRSGSNIKEFLDLIRNWQDYAKTHKPDKLLERILEDTEYINSLGNPRQLEVASKIENIGQLLTAIREFMQEHPHASLAEYLEAVALTTHADELRDIDAVSLMTIHCAKGLEFRVVFLVGLDEPIFPSHRTLEETGDIEEERRLFYVGITRCKEILFLSRANLRTIYGRTHFMTPSRFLKEVPPKFITSYKNRQYSL
ncbi:MAG: ATP-dependent helicase, partial [Candidatus Sumerlaeia bacterium]|nr:ATP-dependent helicase [Candidatus Sumerlaeia bacterium]